MKIFRLFNQINFNLLFRGERIIKKKIKIDMIESVVNEQSRSETISYQMIMKMMSKEG
jgi:hypothetical protein